MFADAPEMDGPVEVLWDYDLARESRARARKVRRKLYGRAHKQMKLRALLVESQGGLCHYCGRRMVNVPRVHGQPVHSESETLEHLVSHLDGGKTSQENCVAACFGCNGLKSKLDVAARMLERAMREGFPFEVHYYANRLSAAFAEWEERVETASRIVARSDTTENTGVARKGESLVGEAETPTPSRSPRSSMENMR